MSDDLRARMAALRERAATPARPVKPLRTSAPRDDTGAARFTVHNCQAMTGQSLQRIRETLRARPNLSLGEHTAIIIGCDHNPTPDYAGDRGVAYILEEWIVNHGARVQRCRETWSRLCRNPSNYTEVWLPARGQFIREDDHNRALCLAIISYYANELAILEAADQHDGTAAFADTPHTFDLERQARETFNNPRGH